MRKSSEQRGLERRWCTCKLCGAKVKGTAERLQKHIDIHTRGVTVKKEEADVAQTPP